MLLVTAVAAAGAALITGCASTTAPARNTAADAAAPHTSAPAAPTTPTPRTSHSAPATSTPHSSSPTHAVTTAAPAATTPTCTTQSQLANWSTYRLAMTTIAVPVDENNVSAATAEVSQGAGGVLLFGTSAPASLGSDLAALRANTPGHVGLLAMTDEEGGQIQRMSNLVGNLPWQSWMAQNWSPGQVRSAMAAMGKQMAAAGVNMDLAPVADVDGRQVVPGPTNPDGVRAFSGDSNVVSQYSVAAMQGLRDAGVVPVVKHFPGLGGSNADSDYAAANTVPWSTEQQVGIPPFQAQIAAGAPAIMVANNTVPGLTTGPASLSSAAITGELRDHLGFHGLVITDSLDAGAITAAGYDLPSASVQAIRAGADMVMFSNTAQAGPETSAIANAITSAVDNGQLSRARLVSAAASVLAVRNVNLCG
ncbi:beta-N-acetylhexosaminidase [Streptacidiphilus sp. BW17]